MRRGTPRRKELASKPIAHEFVSGLGMDAPKKYATIENIEDLGDLELPESFVLKPVRGWSARGVMLLKGSSRTGYFDHLALRQHSLGSITKLQTRLFEDGRASGGWIVEEAVESLVTVGPVPFDYKFYSFNGTVGLILQIDRNTHPTRVAMFDGHFRPLVRGHDFIFGGSVRPATPIIPLHAPEMLYWAEQLSARADSPFVSIDMYDSLSGPKFGEFTYSPGGAHKRMFVFSHALLDLFDALMEGTAPTDTLAGSPLEVRREVPLPATAAYTAWASYAYNEGARGAERLAAYYRKAAQGATGPAHEWSVRLGEDWESVLGLLSESAPKRLSPTA